MTAKLSISELLKKHHPCTNYGDLQRHAATLGVTTKQFARWRDELTMPNSEQTITLLRKMGQLKHYASDV